MRIQRAPEAFGFTPHDRRRLRKALAEADNPRVYVRMKAVLLVAEGMLLSAVAKLFEKSRWIVYQWVAAYLEHHQPTALEDAPRSGRPLSAPCVTDERILRELRRNPLELGYRTTVWTVDNLAAHLSHRYGCAIGPFTLYRRMIKMGLRSKRPRYVYSEKDPNRAQKKGPLSES